MNCGSRVSFTRSVLVVVTKITGVKNVVVREPNHGVRPLSVLNQWKKEENQLLVILEFAKVQYSSPHEVWPGHLRGGRSILAQDHIVAAGLCELSC